MADEIELTTKPIEGLDPDWQRFIEDRLGHTLETPPPDEPVEDEPEEEVPDETVDDGEEEGVEGDEEVEDEALAQGYDLAPGVTLDHDTALTLYQFDQLLRQRPDIQATIQEALGAPQPAPQQAPAPTLTPAQVSVPEPPPLTDDELLDPSIRALYDYNRALAAQLTELNTKFTATQQGLVVRDTQEFVTQANTVKAQFAAKYSLTPEQVESVAKHADELGVTRHIPYSPDRPKAINDALEMSYWSMPEHRAEALDQQLKSRAQRTKKRQRLAGVGGGGGGSTRRDSAPADPRTMNEADRRKAMALDIAEQTGYSTYEAE